MGNCRGEDFIGAGGGGKHFLGIKDLGGNCPRGNFMGDNCLEGSYPWGIIWG